MKWKGKNNRREEIFTNLQNNNDQEKGTPLEASLHLHYRHSCGRRNPGERRCSVDDFIKTTARYFLFLKNGEKLKPKRRKVKNHAIFLRKTFSKIFSKRASLILPEGLLDSRLRGNDEKGAGMTKEKRKRKKGSNNNREESRNEIV